MRAVFAILMFGAMGCGAQTRASSPAATVAAQDNIAQPGDRAIVNVSVVDVQRESVLPDRVVIVRDGVIVAVEPADSVELPASVERIDGRKAFLMPGLADMHVHTYAPGDMTMFVAAGITTVRNMYGAPEHLALRAKIAAGEVFGPTLVTAGPLVDGHPAIWPGSVEITDPADADRIVVEQQAAGYDFLKVYSMLSADAYRALAAAATRHAMPFAGHVPLSVPLSEIFSSGQRSIEHLEGYLPALLRTGATFPQTQSVIEAMTFLAENADESKLAGLAATTAQSAVWNCPTLVVWERLGRLSDPEKVMKETRWAEYVSSQMRAYWNPKADFRLKDLTDDDYVHFRKVVAIDGRIVAAIHQAGGKVLVGTDSGNPYVVPGASLHDEMELLIGFGVPRPAVLRAATMGAADFLGKAQTFGVVAPGARADLLLTSTNPLTGPIAIPPAGVMVRGVWQSQAELQAALDALRE